MSLISLPNPLVFDNKSTSEASLVLEPLFPGYGTTVGNLLRRVLISSLHGVAVSAVKIEGVDHEFSAVEYIKEDVTKIIRNIKQLRLKARTEITEPLTMTLSITGEKEVKGSDVDTPSELEVVNPDQLIATLTDTAANLEMTFKVEPGIGYVGVDDHENKDGDIGWINIDSIFTPIINVGMEISNVRVGEMTNYEKLVLEIQTDNSRTPEEAVNEALDIVLEQINFLRNKGDQDITNSNNESQDTESTENEVDSLSENNNISESE